MTIDPYSPCPGGTGKKIKFCCSDLVHELDKLQRMIDGDQRVAGLDYVTKLDEKYPGRACLLSARATLEAMLGNREQSAATLASFREKHPENPIALAELAVLQATGEKPTDAIQSLEKALELSGEEMVQPLYEALGAVARSLAEAGHFVPALALLWFQVNISRGEDKQAIQQWASLDGDPAIPLLLKDQSDLASAPPGSPWKYEFDIACERGMRGHWRAAADKFAALIPIAGQSPALWQNLARLRSRLGDYAGAVEALRKYAALDVPLDDAVEAEALAMILEASQSERSTAEPPPSPADQVMVTLAVLNQSTLEERFAADSQVDRVPFDPRSWNEINGTDAADQPPPRAGYSLADRPAPPVEGLTREQVPHVLGTLLLFSRQTDRAERLEVIGSRADVAAARSHLSRIGGDALGDVVEEKTLSIHPGRANGLSWQWRFPEDLPNDRRIELIEAERRHRLLEAWPDTSLADLNGQTPRQAAANPQSKNRVLALILLMDAAPDATDANGRLLDELRQRLSLSILDPIDPKAVAIAALPRVRLGRIQADKLGDDELLRCYRRASFPPQRAAVVMFAKEIVGRTSFAGRAEVLEAFGILADSSSDTNVALAYIEQGRAAAQRAKQSTAPWDLDELDLRLRRGEGEEASRLLQHLQREHAKEPGVNEALFRMLYEAGVIDQQGRRVVPSQPQSSPILVPGAAAAPGKILVPGGDSAVPAGQSAKPVIWTPGMD
jgi:tetratricopeptide (TPR) repeat protein